LTCYLFTLFIYFFTCSEFPNKHFIFNNQFHWFVQFQIHTGRWTGQPLNFLWLCKIWSCFVPPSVSPWMHFLDPPASWQVLLWLTSYAFYTIKTCVVIFCIMTPQSSAGAIPILLRHTVPPC
jgi:hypothetical protein